MSRLLSPIIALFLVLPLTLPAQAAEQPESAETAINPPQTFKNTYEASYYGFSITVTHELSNTAKGKKLRFFADSMLASIEEISYFDWPTEEQLRPTTYIYKRRGLGRDRDAKLKFDWDNGKVTNNVEDKPWKMDIHPGVMDKMSFQMQLQRDLIAGKHENLVYDIADGGHIKQYTFAIVGRETLDTPLGKVDTVKVERTRKNDDRVTYAWMAPDFQYLLVRMQQEEGGDEYTIYIHESEIDGEKISSFE
ncbi:DUF3108 domain-containing protein [Gilvimarinus sp. DA14]|uniref:DUF3108 domain-containing protein n=1 Tax=Gilvimarinus sp. DA14 TaxID=2956798 RepID=UPI0020B6FEF9|nr:DUF3108 domain-containing protein [Gilvimarinus sp. DA14]UTF60197.1 DUF3108 domain-containing protein [Gilvimarinus sp. DA14]